MKRIKKNDEVLVTAGKSKGHIGKVLKVDGESVYVEGANLIKKHVKSNPQQPERASGIVTIEAGLHVSNVSHFDPATKKPAKVGFKYLDVNGTKKKVRYLKTNDEIIDRD
mgnify:CR=1 FL=1